MVLVFKTCNSINETTSGWSSRKKLWFSPLHLYPDKQENSRHPSGRFSYMLHLSSSFRYGHLPLIYGKHHSWSAFRHACSKRLTSCPSSKTAKEWLVCLQQYAAQYSHGGFCCSIELTTIVPWNLVGSQRFELWTSALSGQHSCQLS